MGHTLVAGFSGADLNRITSLLTEDERKVLCKIPFGRGCDRDEADRALPYHMTLAHWSAAEDPLYLPRLDALRFCLILLKYLLKIHWINNWRKNVILLQIILDFNDNNYFFKAFYYR